MRFLQDINACAGRHDREITRAQSQYGFKSKYANACEGTRPFTNFFPHLTKTSMISPCFVMQDKKNRLINEMNTHIIEIMINIYKIKLKALHIIC